MSEGRRKNGKVGENSQRQEKIFKGRGNFSKVGENQQTQEKRWKGRIKFSKVGEFSIRQGKVLKGRGIGQAGLDLQGRNEVRKVGDLEGRKSLERNTNDHRRILNNRHNSDSHTHAHTYTHTPIHYTQIQRSTLWRKQIYKQASTRMRTHMYTQTRIHFFYKQPEKGLNLKCCFNFL